MSWEAFRALGLDYWLPHKWYHCRFFWLYEVTGFSERRVMRLVDLNEMRRPVLVLWRGRTTWLFLNLGLFRVYWWFP